MKKHFLFFLSVILCMTVTACGAKTEGPSEDSGVSVSTEVNTGAEEQKPAVDENREDEFSVSEDLASVTLGKYEQNNITQNGTEPIEWIVLATDGDRALLISRYILDCQPYNEGFAACSWEDSSIRKWLNSDFYDAAFSQGEKERIIKSFVAFETAENENAEASSETEDTEGDADSDTAGSEGDKSEIAVAGTEDFVFLLSESELLKYLPDEADVEGDEAYCKATPYAISKGVWTLSEQLYKDRGYADSGVSENCIGAGWWWLRGSEDKSSKASDVDTNGTIRVNGHDVGECHDGVRPAMWIAIN